MTQPKVASSGVIANDLSPTWVSQLRDTALPMLSIQLAKDLRAAGLVWKPSLFDFFHIPDRDLDDQQFVIADLSVDVQHLADGIARDQLQRRSRMVA